MRDSTLVILIVINIGIIIFYLVASFSGSNINPNNQPYSIPLNIIHPPPPDNNTIVVPPDFVYIDMQMNYTNLKTKNPITLTGYGTVGSALLPFIASIDVVFAGASSYKTYSSYEPSGTSYWGMRYTPTNSDLNSLPIYGGASLASDISAIQFPEAGNYTPVLIAELNNGTSLPLSWNDSTFYIQIQQSSNFPIVPVTLSAFATVDGGSCLLYLANKQFQKRKKAREEMRIHNLEDDHHHQAREGQPFHKLRRRARAKKKNGKRHKK